MFPDGSVDTISISASLAALSDELESGGFSITETNWNRSHLVQKLVPFIKRICRVKNCSDVSIHSCTSGWFFCLFLKNSANFAKQKLEAMEATLISRKNSIFCDKNLQKSSKSCRNSQWIFGNYHYSKFCGIFLKTIYFSNEFLKRTQGILKIKIKGIFPKNLRDLKNTRIFAGNVPQVAFQKSG